MNISRKVVAIAAAIAVLAAGGVGIAYAVGGGDSEEQVTGPDAEKAEAAALDAVGGGTVLEAEYQEDGSAGFYEVEVQRPDGSQVEVYIDSQFQPAGSAADDDSGSESEDEGTEGAEDEGSEGAEDE
jgi:Peptidase propeptide and YPEB domain